MAKQARELGINPQRLCRQLDWWQEKGASLQDAPETTRNREKMMFLKKVVTAGALSLLATTSAMACEIGARVSIVGNEFAAIQAVGAGAQECTGASVEANLTSEHQTINVAG